MICTAACACLERTNAGRAEEQVGVLDRAAVSPVLLLALRPTTHSCARKLPSTMPARGPRPHGPDRTALTGEERTSGYSAIRDTLNAVGRQLSTHAKGGHRRGHAV